MVRSGPGFTSIVPVNARMVMMMACLHDNGGIERRLRVKIEMAAGSLCSDENSIVAVLGRRGAGE